MIKIGKSRTYQFRSKVWVYPGMDAWRFVTISKKDSEAIKKKYGAGARGWGSLLVTATIGHTSWDTSIFPDSKSATYLLPLKRVVRTKEGIDDGDLISYTIRLRLG